VSAHSKLDEAIAHFNAARFYDAHEALEDLWRQQEGPDKAFLQGLVQLAVALHHHSTGNREGARSVLERAAVNLAQAPDDVLGIAMRPLRQSVAQWQQALAGGASLPPLPRLEMRERC